MATMPVGRAIRELLQADADVVALVSGRVGPAPLRGPDEPKVTTPAVTYQRLGSTRLRNMEGRSGPTTTTVQVDCWATDHDTAEDVFEAVRRCLDMKVSKIPHGVALIELVDGSDQFLPEPDTELSRFTADFQVSHTEEAPKQ